MLIDHWVARLLIPLAIWIVINACDDLIVDFAALAAYVQQFFSKSPNVRIPSEEELSAVPPRRMAVFVAVWKEHRVIQKMIDNNLSRLRYPECDFFVGAYPNDPATIAAIREAMKRFPQVHLSICPHGGPTSKADCLNWIYQRMLLYEEERQVRFDMILTHDAEDMVDPDALRWINYYAQWNDFVQLPVLALSTPFRQLSHGVYCDEFAEHQYKDMVARQILGGFIPSNGVGTGFSRRALDALAGKYSNRIFEPACLTEDYENGFRVRNLGMNQKFIPIHFRAGRPVATREYFPQQFWKAVAQRSRWMIGLTLQTWEFHSARETVQNLYWFWRDRKSLIGNLLAPVTNLITVYGTATWLVAHASHREWELGRALAPVATVCAFGMGLQLVHTGLRTLFSATVYGPLFACGVPVRIVVGNWINFLATVRAIRTYAGARLHRQPLRWVKTEHAFPNRAALLPDRKKLGEILTGSQWLTPAELESALSTQPPGLRIGEHLMALGLISEDDLYAALSLQSSLPLGVPDPESISIPITRALPRALARKWRVLPFRIAAGELYLAGSNIPDEDMQREIRRFSSLEFRFQLVTATQFDELDRMYLS